MRTSLKHVWIVLLLAAVLGVFLPGCGRQEAPVTVAPDFVLTTTGGEQVKLSLFRGEKAVVLDFFATWCPPCKAGIPGLVKFNETYAGDDLVVIGVNLQEDKAKVEKLMDQLGVTYQVVLDTNGSVGAAYGVQSIPTYVGIDKNGNVRYRAHHLPAGLDAFVAELTQ